MNAQNPVLRKSTIYVYVHVLAHNVYRCMCVCVSMWTCHYVCDLVRKEFGLESGVSPRDVGFWCFPNQRSGTSSDEDVMSSSGFLFHCNSGPTSHASLLSLSFCLRLYFRLSLCLSLYSICLSVYLSVCFCLSVFISCFHSRCTGSRRSLAVFFLFLWMGCVVYSLTELFLSAMMMNTYSVTTLTSSSIAAFLWLAKALLSMAKAVRLWGSCEISVSCGSTVCVCMYMHVGQSVEGSQRASFQR